MKKQIALFLAVAALSSNAGAAQAEGRAPDGTPLACNFHFRLEVRSVLQVATNPLVVSTDCDSYHIRLDKNASDTSRATFSISQAGEQAFTYYLRDMPLEEPLLLLDPERAATRIVARRRLDRLDFLVGSAPFKAVPPQALLPRAPSAAASRSATGPASKDTLVGSWRTQGMILVIHHNGRFDKVSNVSYGSFGFNDSGTYEVRGNSVVFRGMLRHEWSCEFSTGRLTCDGVSYRKE